MLSIMKIGPQFGGDWAIASRCHLARCSVFHGLLFSDVFPGTAMGIRFHCPNGHKLNVKSELAGKKAICPDCGAKLVVPAAGAATAESSIHQRASVGHPLAVDGAGESRIIAAAAPSAVLRHAASPTVQTSEASPVAIAGGKLRSAIVWYVRPSSGGQFGPIDENELCAWIADGRVVADTYVWRAGWPDWLKAGDAPDELPASLPVTALIEVPVAPVADELVLGGPSDFEATADGPVPAAAPVDELAPLPITGVRRPRRQTPLFVTILLIIAIVVLSGVLIWVIRRNAGNESPVPQADLAPLVESHERT